MHGGPHGVKRRVSQPSVSLLLPPQPRLHRAAPEPPRPVGFCQAGSVVGANPLPPASRLEGPSRRDPPRLPLDPSAPLSTQEKSKRLEVELDEERTTVELLTERVNRSRDQVGREEPPLQTRLVPGRRPPPRLRQSTTG